MNFLQMWNCMWNHPMRLAEQLLQVAPMISMLEEISSNCSSESPGDGISCKRACTNIVQRIRSAKGITSLLQKDIVSKQQRKEDVKLKASHGAASLAISQKNISEYWLQGKAARHQRILQKYHGSRTAETAPDEWVK